MAKAKSAKNLKYAKDFLSYHLSTAVMLFNPKINTIAAPRRFKIPNAKSTTFSLAWGIANKRTVPNKTLKKPIMYGLLPSFKKLMYCFIVFGLIRKITPTATKIIPITLTKMSTATSMVSV